MNCFAGYIVFSPPQKEIGLTLISQFRPILLPFPHVHLYSLSANLMAKDNLLNYRHCSLYISSLTFTPLSPGWLTLGLPGFVILAELWAESCWRLRYSMSPEEFQDGKSIEFHSHPARPGKEGKRSAGPGVTWTLPHLELLFEVEASITREWAEFLGEESPHLSGSQVLRNPLASSPAQRQRAISTKTTQRFDHEDIKVNLGVQKEEAFSPPVGLT